MTVQLSLFDKVESEKIKQSKFKDKCDVCGKFEYLRGYNNICICEKCRKEKQKEEYAISYDA